MKTRRQSREIVFALLFEWSFKEGAKVADLLESAQEAREVTLDSFATELLEKTILHVEEIDGTIAEYSEKWKLNRISRVSLASLRLALCELLYFPDIPEGATINEAVELVKKFGTEEEAAYTNGILGGYSRKDKALDAGKTENEEVGGNS